MPLRVQLQTQLYMAATRLKVCNVIALLKGSPHIFVQHFDPEAATVICECMEQFYRRYIIGDEMPPLDTSEAAGRYLQQLYPRHRARDIVEATPEQADILDDYLTVRVEQKVLQDTRDRIEVRLKQEVGNHEGLRWQDGVFTWRNTKDKKITDWKAMALGLLHGYVPDAEEQIKLTDFYTRTKEGSRRVWLASDQLKDALESEAAA
jgi:predicted phage-related endonuclease